MNPELKKALKSRWRKVKRWLTRGEARFDVAAIALLLCGMVLLYGFGQARYGLFDVDEAIFTRATVEMRHQTEEGIAQWAMPSYNGEPRYHKPPLFYWMQSLGMSVMGEQSLTAARLPSVLSALLSIAALGGGLYWLTERKRWALWSAAFLGVSLSFLVVGRAATADGVLNLIVILTTLGVLRLLYGPRWKKGWIWVGVLAGLGFLAKGPIAWLVPGVVGLTVLLARGDFRGDWERAKPNHILVVAIAVTLPWVGLLALQGGWDFFYQFFVVHNLQRFGPGMGNTQSHNPFYYVFVLLIGYFPMVMLLPAVVQWVLKDWRQRLASDSLARALPALGLIWAVVIVVFFSFSGTKLAHYIVPAYSGLALACGAYLERMPRTRGLSIDRWGVWLVALVMMLVVGALAVLLGALQTPVLHGWASYIQTWFGMPWPPKNVLVRDVLMQDIAIPHVGLAMLVILIWFSAFTWGIASIKLRKNLQTWRVWLASALVVWACTLMMVVLVLVPLVWRYTEAPLAQLAGRIEQAPVGMQIIHLGLHKPSVLWLSDRPFTKLERALQVPRTVPVGSRALVLVEHADVPALLGEFQVREGTVTPQVCTGGYCLMLVDRVKE